MNYLAHAWLWPDDDQTLAGSLFGDFIHGSLPAEMPPKLAAAIKLHRRIDRETDAFPEVVLLREQMPPQFRRYAGIILDMGFDHLLARDFARWSAEPLPAFAQRVYDAVAQHRGWVPEQRQLRIDYLIQHRLLDRYAQREAVIAALKGISSRLSKANPLAEAGPLLIALEPSLTAVLPRLLQHLTSSANLFRLELPPAVQSG